MAKSRPQIDAIDPSIYLALAAAAAEPFVGATSPNPPVGAVLVHKDRVIGIGAHERAGTDHAEIKALRNACDMGAAELIKGATIYVTLEPCNHVGRTPPCTRALVESGITKVVLAERDPNHKVAGGGAAALRQAGLEVEEFPSHSPSRRLIDGFAKQCRTGRPWVVLKRAYRFRADSSLTSIPEAGSRTFTSPDSLTEAHRERRRSDAMITGLGTVLADSPLFSVRRVNDHAGKRRTIVVLSRKASPIPQDWLCAQAELGHDVVQARSPDEALDLLGKRGALRVLVEAGPTIAAEFERAALWDERLVFIRPHGESVTDILYRERACLQG